MPKEEKKKVVKDSTKAVLKKMYVELEKMHHTLEERLEILAEVVFGK